MIKLRSKHLSENENLAGYLFISPALIGLIIFSIIPILFSIYLSFNQWNFLSGFDGIKFNGVRNFAALTKDSWFVASVKNSFIFSITTVPVGLGISLIVAVLLDKYSYFSGGLKVMLFIPYISSVVASAVVWNVVLHPSYGPVNMFLHSIGIENTPKWFQDMKWALPSLIIFTIWQTMGYYIVVYMAGLKNIPKDLYEAAVIDGASEVKKFWYITIPMVSPTTFFLFVLGLISSFKAFDQVSVLTEGGPGSSTSIIAYYIYRTAFEYYEMGMASAAAWIMFVVIFGITLIQWRAQEKFVNY